MLKELERYFAALLESVFGWEIYVQVDRLPYKAHAQDLAEELRTLDESTIVKVEKANAKYGKYLTYDFTLDVCERPSLAGFTSRKVVVIRS
jgi:hypothetical protein